MESLFQISAREALAAFRQYGIEVAGMTAGEVKAARNRLLALHHPDHGGTLGAAQEINAAYDVLKDGIPILVEQPDISRSPSASTCAAPRKSGRYWDPSCLDDQPPVEPTYRTGGSSERLRTAIPEWAWAGCRGSLPSSVRISRNDFTDANFIKKSMWELSNKSRREYTIWGYDGTHFRNWITVYGAPHIFNYMAMAMVEWQTKGHCPSPCRAVFANGSGSKDLYLIYADGTYYGDAPCMITHNSFNSNPENDERFMLDALPRFLALLKSRQQEARAAAA
jgi:hypothetical protein